MYKISIIIPIYNAEKYLRDLLNSITNQTMNLQDIQVIMVDDLSTDNSVKIMREYADQYDNFMAIELKQNNKIAGTARNEGIKQAKGKYLMFADSDDFYTKDACEVMYKAIEEKEADFITANYINTDQDGTRWDRPIFDKKIYKDFKLSIYDYKQSFFILNSGVWNKIFRKSFVDKNKIRFLEGVPAEDAYFTTSCFMKSDCVYYISEIIYCYRQRNQDKNNTSVSFYCSKNYFDGINRAYRAIYENFNNSNYLRFYRYVYAKNMSYMLYKFIDSKIITDEEKKEILKEMKWFYELSIKLKVPAPQTCQTMIIEKILENDYDTAVNYCKIVADIRAYLPKEIRESMSRPDAKMYGEIGKYDEEY